ncbi:GntR family transcriptional regulator [Streptomyces hygroscopicus]|nr:GntR family transcriptional regulator [Streptomyces hygroscopicus]
MYRKHTTGRRSQDAGYEVAPRPILNHLVRAGRQPGDDTRSCPRSLQP